jgi:two-component system, response regulator PdtaR
MVPQTRPQVGELRVLVVEDEMLIRIAVAEELRAAGLRVVETVTADEAWSYLQAGGQADLVFTDICLPGSMDGLEFARRVKAHYPDLNIILTSGNDQHMAMDGLGHFLPKPYAIDHAVKLILASLNLKTRAAP